MEAPMAREGIFRFPSATLTFCGDTAVSKGLTDPEGVQSNPDRQLLGSASASHRDTCSFILIVV